MSKLTKKSLALTAVSFVIAAVVFGVLFHLLNQNKRLPVSEAVVGISEAALCDDGLYLRWNCYNTYLTSYNIYRSVNRGKSDFLLSLKNDQKSFVDEDISDGMYSYYVKGINSETNDSVKVSQPSELVYINISFEHRAAGNNSFELGVKSENNTVELFWEMPYNKAFTDCVIMRKSSSGEWTEYASVKPSSTEYKIENPIRGDCYKIVFKYTYNDERKYECESDEVII